MKKLTSEEKRDLKKNLKALRERQSLGKVHFIWYYLLKLNFLAKKYNIDLYAIPVDFDHLESDGGYFFEYKDNGKTKVYEPNDKTIIDLWSKDSNVLGSLRKKFPDRKIAFFVVLLCFSTGRINRKNFYKDDKPAAYGCFFIY